MSVCVYVCLRLCVCVCVCTCARTHACVCVCHSYPVAVQVGTCTLVCGGAQYSKDNLPFDTLSNSISMTGRVLSGYKQRAYRQGNRVSL